jgi:hypothetical protein
VYTGFRLSASKVTSFYKSQGFLFNLYISILYYIIILYLFY